MVKVDVILFDLDGTLIDSRKDIVNAANFMLKETGRPGKTFDEIVSYIGGGVKDLVKRCMDDDDPAAVAKGLEVFRRRFGEHSTDESALYPNVKEVLEHFRDKKKMIITNRARELALRSADILGVTGYFEDVVGADDEACMKPSACPIESGIKRFPDKYPPGRMIMVGDMDIDIYTGKNAGILTCGVTYGVGDESDIRKACPDYVIGDIIELESIIS